MSHAIDVLAQTLFPAVLQKIWNAMFAFGGPFGAGDCGWSANMV